jgi:hypothetical protein
MKANRVPRSHPLLLAPSGFDDTPLAPEEHLPRTAKTVPSSRQSPGLSLETAELRPGPLLGPAGHRAPRRAMEPPR